MKKEEKKMMEMKKLLKKINENNYLILNIFNVKSVINMYNKYIFTGKDK